MTQITTFQLDCGMPLIVEHIDSVASLAVNWLLPVGSAADPADGDGHSAMLSELIFRGAGAMSSREHSDALDRLGVQRSSHVSSYHLRIDATMLGERLDEALPLLAMMVREPKLADASVDPVRSLCLQSLDGLDDDPQQLVMLRVRERHRPPPFNRHGYGERRVLETVDGEALRRGWFQRALPEGAILAAAGDVDPQSLADRLNRVLAGWTGRSDEPQRAQDPARGVSHYPQETAQVHIGLAYDAPAESHAHSMLERLAIGVLSGSTSGRLFTEVRQKRSLCYSVHASYRAGRDDGVVTLYAGTTPERAQETLDVCIAEVNRLRDGVREDEFNRAVIGLKSRLIMQGESTPARAASLAADYFRLGRARPLDEIAEAVDAITLDALNDYIAGRDPGEFTVASIGPTALDPPAT
jgi:predicted Zn-dependent peptidase